MADMEKARKLASDRIDAVSSELRTKVNQVLHSNPELSFKEFMAHDTIADYLTAQGFDVKRHAYGIETSFEASVGTGGRQVVVCCEYDALPDIGHGCGHNLIAVSSIATFLGAAHAIKTLSLPGRLRLLGTPAEEAGGGKAVLLDRGAFKPESDIAAAIMSHPSPSHSFHRPGTAQSVSGIAGMMMLARESFSVDFRGKPAHAAGEPWNGVNALDAAVAAYSNAALLRQQIRPDERIHAIIKQGGVAPNIIPDYTRMEWCVRAPTAAAGQKVFERVKKCIEAAATAAGCTHEISIAPMYMDLVVNETLCKAYVDEMKHVGETIHLRQDEPYTASTDMGNVSHAMPAFHGGFSVEAPAGVSMHSREFAKAAGMPGAHEAAMKCAKGMAALALRVLLQQDVADGARQEYQALRDKQASGSQNT